MKKVILIISVVFCMTNIFGVSFKNSDEIAICTAVTVPFALEINDWNNTSKTITSSATGGEIQVRFKPFALPFGLYAQVNFSQPQKITEKRSSITFHEKRSDYSSIWTSEIQAGAYFRAYESALWYVPFGVGFHYKLNYSSVTNIETTSKMFGIGAFIQGELKLTRKICTYIGANLTYDFRGSSRRECSAGGSTAVYYSESGILTNLGFMPKLGLVFHNR